MTVVFDCVASVNVGAFGPLTSVHKPVPIVGEFPVSVIDVTLHKS